MLTKGTKWVPGYEGLYAVSVEGYVFRYYKSGNIKQVNPCQNRSGYLILNLSKNSKRKTQLVHRLIAQVFVPNPEDLPFVDHIDEDKTNSAADNLRWCTPQQNSDYYATNDGRAHQIRLAQKRKDKLKKYEESLREVRRQLNEKEKELKKRSKELGEVERKLQLSKDLLKNKTEIFQEHIDHKVGCSREKYQDYMNTKGVKFSSVDELAEITGKPVIINKIHFRSCKSAAKYIVQEELKLGYSRNEATISKELRRYLKGLRPSWAMYYRYTVSG